MKYEIPSPLKELTADTYINKLIKYIGDDKDLRDRINKFTQLKQLYIKRMLYIKEIDETEYRQLNISPLARI